MYIGLHQIPQRGIDFLVALHPVESFESFGNDDQPEMSPAIARPGMANVQVTFIFDVEQLRVQGGSQPLANLIDSRSCHGSTFLKGRTLTCL